MFWYFSPQHLIFNENLWTYFYYNCHGKGKKIFKLKNIMSRQKGKSEKEWTKKKNSCICNSKKGESR